MSDENLNPVNLPIADTLAKNLAHLQQISSAFQKTYVASTQVLDAMANEYIAVLEQQKNLFVSIQNSYHTPLTMFAEGLPSIPQIPSLPDTDNPDLIINAVHSTIEPATSSQRISPVNPILDKEGATFWQRNHIFVYLIIGFFIGVILFQVFKYTFAPPIIPPKPDAEVRQAVIVTEVLAIPNLTYEERIVLATSRIVQELDIPLQTALGFVKSEIKNDQPKSIEEPAPRPNPEVSDPDVITPEFIPPLDIPPVNTPQKPQQARPRLFRFAA